MADVFMPQMGESIAEGTVTKWLKNVGDKVERDEPLFEISTDKVDAEIPSPAAGILKEIRVGPGTTVPINTVVGVIAAEGEAQAQPQPQAEPTPQAAPPPGVTTLPPIATSPPRLGGTAREGTALTVSLGGWSVTQPTTYAYQWLRCNAGGGSCAAIGEATK